MDDSANTDVLANSASNAGTLASDRWRWWRKMGVRAGWYAIALGALTYVAELRWYPLTIVAAMGVAAAGVAFHQTTGRPNDPRLSGSPGLKALVFVLSIELGALIIASQQWRILGRVGFIGLSLIGFGFGQLIAEVRGLRSLRGPIVGLLWLNCLAGLFDALFVGAGGIVSLVIGIVFALPAVALSSEYVMNWLTELNWSVQEPGGQVSGDGLQASATRVPRSAALLAEIRRAVTGDGERETCVKTLRSPARMAGLAALGLGLSALGAVLMSSVGGWRLAIILAVVVLLLLAMVSSNTDADVLVLLFSVAVVWTQLPRGTEAIPEFSTDATRNVVVLGDSYISGEGARSYFVGTNTREPAERNECRQSMRAWAQLVFANRSDIALDFLACSGAVVPNISASGEGQYVGENPVDEYVVRGDDPEHVLSQLERWDLLQEDPERSDLEVEWVFVSIGGNDAEFGEVVADCLAPGDCSRTGQLRLDQLEDVVEPRLDELYGELEEKFRGRVAVIPYPEGIVDDDDLAAPCSVFRSTLTSREREFVSGFTRQLNALIRYQAAEHSLRYVAGMEDVFTGRRICETDRANANVNYIALNPVGGDTDPSGWLHNSMHPNEHGHALMAGVVEEWLVDPPAPEDPAGVARPSLSLNEIMDDDVIYCESAEDPAGCIPPPSLTMFERLRQAIHHHLAGIVLVLLGGWLTALAVLARRQVVRKPMTGRFTPWLSHQLDGIPTRIWRAVAAVPLIAIPTAAFFVLLNVMVALDDGYGAAQSKSAGGLRALDEFQLRSYLAATSRDMVWYIPGYVLFGTAVVLLTAQRRYQPLTTYRLVATAETDTDAQRYHFYRGLSRRTWIALGTLVIAGLADIGETLLFRTSLIRLTHQNSDVGALATWTRMLTGVKWVAAAAALVIVVTGIVVRRQREPLQAS